MNVCPASNLGDFSAEGIEQLAVIPLDAEAALPVRALHVLVRETLSPDPLNFWLLQLGTLVTGAFEVQRETSFAGGFTAMVKTVVPYRDPVLPSRGDTLALRVSPRGLPPPIVGLSVVVEWGVLSSKRGV